MWLHSLSWLRKNFNLVFPYHKYLGPGNEINNGVPVDNDDLIAALHDIAYLEARSEQEIIEADLHYIRDFFQEFIINGNFHALVGASGLWFKQLLERKIGVIYPSMSSSERTTHRGNRLYAERQKELSKLFKDYKRKGGREDYWSFCKKQKAGESSVSSSTLPSSTLRSTSTTETPIEVIDSPESMENLNFQDDEMEHSHQQASTVRSAGHATGMGSISHMNKHLSIPRSLRQSSYTLRFGKSRIFYSYGYAFRNIIEKSTSGNIDQGDQVYMTTSLAFLPNDMIGFYCSPYELSYVKSIGSARIKNCKVSVVPQGLRTAFDTGSTLSGTATSEHCAIGISAVGLNQKYYIMGGIYESSTESPMVPTKFKGGNIESCLTKYYGDVNFNEHGPMCLGVPRHVDFYTVLVSNSNRDVPGYATHNEGFPHIDKFIHRYNFLPKIGEKIIDWNYQPTYGYIFCKPHDIPYIRADSDTVYVPHLNLACPTKATTSCSKDGESHVKILSNAIDYVTTNTTAAEGCYYSIDGTKVLTLNQAHTTVHKVIPQIHFGILPTPQLNPANDNTNFQNTASYYSVKCEIIIEVNAESKYGADKEYPHAYNDELVMFGSRDRVNYTAIEPVAQESFGN